MRLLLWVSSPAQLESCWCLPAVWWFWSAGRSHIFLQFWLWIGCLGPRRSRLALWWKRCPHENPLGLHFCVGVTVGHGTPPRRNSWIWPMFFFCGLLAPHFSWIRVDAHFQLCFVVVDDLGGYIYLLAIICILVSLVNPLKVLGDGNHSVWYLIKYLLVFFVVSFCDFTASVHEIMDKINSMDPHEYRELFSELSDVSVFYRLNYLVIE